MRADLKALHDQMKELRRLRVALVAQGKWVEASKLEPDYQRLLREYNDIVRKETLQ
ncbi:hypothetical protein M0R72_16665 [Candidatus Pacearchaeota archaeon]|jgi:hypothetical protein|nr:hypothetical protein [Candidatus Pacearchaeota archaeon]